MNKEDYKIALTNPLWRAKRLEILKRDGYKCTKCSKTTKLHVHHIIYSGEYPWESKNEELITLCKKCHEAVHGIQSKKVVTKRRRNNKSFYVTEESLKKYLKIDSKKVYSKFIKKLIKCKIVYWIRGRFDEKVQVVYMNKSNDYETETMFKKRIYEIFEQFKKDNPKLLN